MLTKYRYFLTGLALFLFLGIIAQPTDNSPYSSFGIGNIHSDDLVFYQGFGGLGASYLDPHHLNLKNPASYSFLKATAFEAGISSRFSRFSDSDAKEGIWSGNLDYLALGFPLRNPINASLDRLNQDYALGMSLFLKPHSTVGYNIGEQFSHSEFGDYGKTFEGNGGTYKLMWGNSLRYKSFSVGANIGYLFGNIVLDENVYFGDLDFSFENRFTMDYNVNGFIWDAGVVYNWFLNKKAYEKNKNTETKILNFGLYGNSAQNFYTKGINSEMSIYPETGFTDTLVYQGDLTGTGKLPFELGFGATYFYGNMYAIGLNYEYGGWSQYENSLRNETLSDSYKLSLGGFYRPDANSFNRYFKRVSYKFGVFYAKNPQKIDNLQITDTGINLGASFPFYYQRKISHINFAVQLGMRGQNTPIQERYVKLNLGFTFNDDEWFLKRKYN